MTEVIPCNSKKLGFSSFLVGLVILVNFETLVFVCSLSAIPNILRTGTDVLSVLYSKYGFDRFTHFINKQLNQARNRMLGKKLKLLFILYRV